PDCRLAIPSSSRSSSRGSMRTLESDPMQSSIPRCRRRSTGRKASPRVASLRRHAQTRVSGSGSRSSSCPSACVAWTTVVRGPRQPQASRSSIGRTPYSARPSSISRGCSSAWTWSRSPPTPRVTPGPPAGGLGARTPPARGVGPGLREPLPRAGANGVRRDSDADPVTAQLLDLPQVLRHRRLSEAVEPAACVRDVEKDELDARFLGRFGCGACLLEPEVVELADGGVACAEQLAIDVDVARPDLSRGLTPGELEHRVAPCPEIVALRAPAQGSLERVTVGVDEAGDPRQLGHAAEHTKRTPVSFATWTFPPPPRRSRNF